MLGVVRLLASTELTHEQQQYVEMLTSSGQLLLSIISDILDFSKIESDKMVLESRDFSLLECIETSIHMVFDMAVQKQLDLAFSFSTDVPRYVKGDSARLQQILLNLLSNAIKFGRKGFVKLNVSIDKEYEKNKLYQIKEETEAESQGHDESDRGTDTSHATNAPHSDSTTSPRSVSAGVHSVSGAGRSGRARQSSSSDILSAEYYYLRGDVIDDGIGIADELQPKLFTSFMQAESNTTRRFGGTGLGLAISRKLAEAMGGSLTVKSKLHVGSTFTFVVKLQQSDVYKRLRNQRVTTRSVSTGADATSLTMPRQQVSPFATLVTPPPLIQASSTPATLTSTAPTPTSSAPLSSTRTGTLPPPTNNRSTTSPSSVPTSTSAPPTEPSPANLSNTLSVQANPIKEDNSRKLSGESQASGVSDASTTLSSGDDADIKAMTYPHTVHALKQSTAAVLAGKRVLVISEGKASGESMVELLQPHGVSVKVVHDTTSAVAELRLDKVRLRRRSFSSDTEVNDTAYDFMRPSSSTAPSSPRTEGDDSSLNMMSADDELTKPVPKRQGSEPPHYDLIIHNSFGKC